MDPLDHRYQTPRAGPRRGGRLQRWRQASALLLLSVCIGLAFWVRRSTEIELDPAALREQIAALGWWAPVAFVAAAALRIFLVLPSFVLLTVGGLLFGVAGGTVYGALGLTLGGFVPFAVARGLGRDALAGRLSGGLARVDALARERGPRWLALYMALPVSALTPAQGAAGLSGIPAVAFALASAAGLLPRAFLYSLFGDRLVEGNVQQIIIGGVALGLLALIGIRIGRRLAERGRGNEQ